MYGLGTLYRATMSHRQRGVMQSSQGAAKCNQAVAASIPGRRWSKKCSAPNLEHSYPQHSPASKSEMHLLCPNTFSMLPCTAAQNEANMSVNEFPSQLKCTTVTYMVSVMCNSVSVPKYASVCLMAFALSLTLLPVHSSSVSLCVT